MYVPKGGGGDDADVGGGGKSTRSVQTPRERRVVVGRRAARTNECASSESQEAGEYAGNKA